MDVAKSLDGLDVNGYQIVARILPIEWRTVKERIEALMDEVQPAVVLSLGLAAGDSEVSIENVAINHTSTAKDNVGVVPAERPIVPGGADAYLATIPVERIADAINKKGIPARVSLSAGADLCNYVFYCASRYARERGARPLVGFIHVPATPPMMAGKSWGGPSMAQDLIKEAVLQAVITLTS
jgi:pyroglutamyl-peptidase